MKTISQFDISVWQEFCFDIIDAKSKDFLESQYQDIIEAGLRQLGWSKVKGEICPKERINVGSNNQLEPDITVKINGKPVFVIEVKRPNNSITIRQKQQLLSYMRVRQNSFGLYVGNEIQLYYDDGSLMPTMVWRTELSLESNDGLLFVDLFHRDTFNENRILKFCEEQYNIQKTTIIMSAFKQSLASDQDKSIKDALMEYFIDFKKCDRNLVKTFLEPIRFSANQAENDCDNSSISSIKSNGIVIMSNLQVKTGKNTTKYSLDGGVTKFGKGKFVREVIVSFLKQNPSLSYKQIKQIFPDHMQGSYGVVRKMEDLINSKQEKKDLYRRYETKSPLKSCDGIEFVVCNQWGSYNFGNILNLLEKWGWDIVTC